MALRFLLPVLLCLAAANGHAQLSLPAPVRDALRAAGIPPEAVAIVVQETGGTTSAIRFNAERAMNPASVMKLVTTYAALDTLGPAYRWRTEVYELGRRSEGALEGSLHIKGYGDPKLTLESLWLLARALRERGLRDLRGELVLDRSYFDASGYDPSRFDGEPLRPYNVAPDALLVSFKSVRFLFVPDPASGTVRVAASPHPRELELSNTLKLVETPCGDWRERIRADFPPIPGGVRAAFSGEFARGCGEREWNVALLPHATYAAGAFREVWQAAGGSWNGSAREGPVPPGAQLVYRHDSAALAEVVRDINKYSNNVMARQLYLTLGAEGSGPPARLESAFQAVRTWLAAKKLSMPELVIDNGSGLSRIERISAQSLAVLLQSAFRSAVMPEFVASLPLVAFDGTMQRRLRNGAAAGQAHIKTGTLHDARSIAGYVLDREGRRHVVVMLVNHPAAARAQAAQDALLSWVYERGSGPEKPPATHP